MNQQYSDNSQDPQASYYAPHLQYPPQQYPQSNNESQFQQPNSFHSNQLLDQLDEVLGKYGFWMMMESKLGARRCYLAIGSAFFLLSFVLFGFGGSTLSNMIGFAYPLYESFKALKSADKKDDVQWLTYWEVFAFFTLIESFTDFFLFWIPFYYFVKICFLTWCFLPQTQGARFLYRGMIEPFLDRITREVVEDVRELRTFAQSPSQQYYGAPSQQYYEKDKAQ